MKKRPKPFKRNESKYYYFHVYENGKRIRKSTGKTTKYEAEQEIDEYLHEKEAENTRPDYTLSEFAADFFVWGKCTWIERQHKRDHPFSKSVADQRRSHLTRYILPVFGAKRITEIKAAAVDDWLLQLESESGKALSNQTKEHLLYTFRIVMREAERRELIDGNPLDKVKPLGKKNKSRDVFTLEELADLFPTEEKELLAIWKTPKHAALFHLLASTGVRSGELRAWQWKDVIDGKNDDGEKIEAEFLLVDKAVKKDGTIGPTKTSEERVVYVPTAARQLLLRWREQAPCSDGNSFMFFGDQCDRPIAARNISHFFKKALTERTKIKTADRNLVVHSFRHTYNTHMRKHLPETILRELTGHKSVSMTELYSHPTPADRIAKLSAARDTIESVFRASQKQES